jgi:hypothetical protein
MNTSKIRGTILDKVRVMIDLFQSTKQKKTTCSYGGRISIVFISDVTLQHRGKPLENAKGAKVETTVRNHLCFYCYC